MEFDLNVALGLDDIPNGEVSNRISVDHNPESLLHNRINAEDIPESEVPRRGSGNEDEIGIEISNSESKSCGSSHGKASKDSNFEGTFEDNDRIAIELEKKLSVGSIVADLERIYILFCEYAHCKGFSVRKGEQRYFGRNDDVRMKEFKCSCSGQSESSSRRRRIGAYKKLVWRSNCPARLIVSRESLGPFQVSFFEKDHNHALVPPDQSYLLRSSRSLNYAKKSVLEALHSAGIGVSRACEFMEKEAGGAANTGFIRKDAYHHFKRIRRSSKVEDGDARSVLELFTSRCNSEPYFFWKYQLDDDGRVMNLFFRDSRCAVDYEAFGDVMSVDTTYRTNRYNLICAPFVGINHHSCSVLFGIGLLSDETVSTFNWLFEAFLESMHGKEPIVICTDQCQAMMNAIDSTFSSAVHRLCQWHVSQNAPAHFGSLNGNSAFKSLWYKCMSRVDSEAEFEHTWREMIETYSLSENRWFAAMYKLRRRWAPVFTRHLFTGGLLATSRSEGTNKVIKDVCLKSSSLHDFIFKYEEILMRWRSKERVEDTYCLWLPGQFTNNDLLTHAASVYTRTIYKKFEFEAIESFNVVLDEPPTPLSDYNVEYKASSKDEGSRVRYVIFNMINHNVRCSCGMWESEGLFCRHIIRVYNVKNVSTIPESYILKRWTKMAKKADREMNGGGVVGCTIKYMLFVNQTMRRLYCMASFAKDFGERRARIVQLLDSLELEFAEMDAEPGLTERRRSKAAADTYSFP